MRTYYYSVLEGGVISQKRFPAVSYTVLSPTDRKSIHARTFLFAAEVDAHDKNATSLKSNYIFRHIYFLLQFYYTYNTLWSRYILTKLHKSSFGP